MGRDRQSSGQVPPDSAGTPTNASPRALRLIASTPGGHRRPAAVPGASRKYMLRSPIPERTMGPAWKSVNCMTSYAISSPSRPMARTASK